MNLELNNKMEAVIKMLDKEIGKLRSQYNKLYEDYNSHVEGVTVAQINEKAREAKKVLAEKAEVVKDLEMYEAAAKDKKVNYRNFVILENDLAKKYDVELIDEIEEVENATQTKVVDGEKVTQVVQVKEKKNHTLRDMIIGGAIVGIAIGAVSCARNNKVVPSKEVTAQVEEENVEHKNIVDRLFDLYYGKDKEEEQTRQPEETQETEQTVQPTEQPAEQPATVVPAEPMETGDVAYGVVDDEVTRVYGHLTDASDEAQVMARAQAIYANHVDLPNVPAAAKAELNIETIANMIRVSNGELAIIDGRPYYEEDIMDVIANDFATYYNITSFVQFGTNLQFAPVAVFFEEDTLAYESAKMQDAYAKRIYDDIRGNQIEQFREDSVAWGEFIRDTFVYNDFTGEVPSIWQMDTASMFPLTSAIISLYAPTIQEYSMGIDLARRDNSNIFGDTFGICVPFCYNEHNELTYIPLSKLIYDINYTPMNDLARSAGMYDQWASEHTPITVALWINSNDFMTDKYEREVGFGRSLK